MGIQGKLDEEIFESLISKEGSVTAQDLFYLRFQLYEQFDLHMANGDKDKILLLLERYVLRFPSEREALMAIYCRLLNEFGDEETANAVGLLVVNVNELMQDFSKKLYHLPFIIENNHLLFRFGEQVDQTLAVKTLLKLGLLDHKPVLPLPDLKAAASLGWRVANSSFVPYMQDSFEIITNQAWSKHLDKIKQVSPFSSVMLKYSDTIWGSFHDNYPAIERLMISKNLKPARLSLHDNTKLAALTYLKDYGYGEGEEFVVLHLREKGFFDPEHHLFRNVNVDNYQSAIEYILKKGLKIIRLGHKEMTPLQEMDGLIDLTQINYPGHVDLFACSEANFYFGSSSGPFSAALGFGTPVACCASLPYTKLRTNTISELQPLFDKTTKKLIKYSEIKERNLQNLSTPKPLEKANVFPGELNREQNLSLAVDMFDFMEGNSILEENIKFNPQKVQLGMDLDCMLTRNSLDLFRSS
jgi:putative glycosyltransferase (TIGR04372 family)